MPLADSLMHALCRADKWLFLFEKLFFRWLAEVAYVKKADTADHHLSAAIGI